MLIGECVCSGLDSNASLMVMGHLQSLARRGITVVVVIHQPSSRCFQFCDDVFLLSRGCCLYNGSAREMAETFALLGHQCPPYFNIAEFGKCTDLVTQLFSPSEGGGG